MTTDTQQPNNNISDKDLELLSAYLDDALTAAERARIEERLQHDPALQSELQSLRETVMLLHDMPTVTPPRSFTLDPVNLPHQRSSLFDWIGSLDKSGLISLQGASVVAVLVLALGISGVLALNTGMGQQTAGLAGDYESASATAPAAAAPMPTGPSRPAMESAAELEEAEQAGADDEAAMMAEDAADMPRPQEQAGGAPMASEAPTAAGTALPPAAPALDEAVPQQQTAPDVLEDSHDTSSPDTRTMTPQQQTYPAGRATGGTFPVGLVIASIVLGVAVVVLALWFWRRRGA